MKSHVPRPLRFCGFDARRGISAQPWRQALQAYTLLELLISVSLTALLGGLLLGASSRAKQTAQGAVCWSQLRQLQLSWQLYVDDHAGWLPPNRCGFTNGAWRSRPSTWLGDHNSQIDESPDALRHGLLYAYLANPDPRIFHCPGDRSRLSRGALPLQSLRLRSYALNGNLAGETNEPLRVAFHERDIEAPATLFGFVDEHGDSIDDGHFLVWPFPDDRWVNLPADRHAGSGTLSMVDGHVERWRWKHPKSFAGRKTYWKRAVPGPDLADLRRLQAATLGSTLAALRERP